MCLGFLLLTTSCGNTAGDTQSATQNTPIISEPGSSNLNLNITGFEKTLMESAAQGSDNSFTLNLTASSLGTNGRMKPNSLIYTKRLSVDDLARPSYRFKAGGDTADEPVSLTLPPMTTDISVRVVGDQSGSIASENIAIDTSTTGTSTLFVNVDRLPEELVAYTTESPVDVSLFTPIAETATDGNKNKVGDPDDKSGSEFLSFTIDPNDGALVPAVKIRSGEGGTGSIGSLDEGGGLGFITQKSKEEGANFTALLRTSDGTMKPLDLPAGSDQTTLAYDTTTRLLYMLKPTENRLLVQQRNEDGTLKTLQELPTGIEPSMLYLAQVARLVTVVNRGDQTVSVFSIDEQGNLTELQTIKMQENPTAIEMDPTGRFIYIALENGGISRFTMGEDRRLTYVNTIATVGGLVSLKMGETGQVLIGVPKPLDNVCPPGQKCKHKRFWRKLVAAVKTVAKIVVTIIKVVACPVGGPISDIMNPLCSLLNLARESSPHWYRELLSEEVTIKVGDNVSDLYRGLLDRSIAEWSQSSRINLRKVSGQSKSCRFIPGRIEVCNDDYGPGRNWTGLAQPLYLDGHMIAAVIRLNDYKLNNPRLYPNESTQDYRQFVMCQEFGHTLGLYLGLFTGAGAHRDIKRTNDNLGTCMDYTKYPVGMGVDKGGTLSNLSPDQYDFDYLKKIHDHYDGVLNIDKLILNILPPLSFGVHIPSSGAAPDGASPAVYQLDLGKGYKISTVVLR